MDIRASNSRRELFVRTWPRRITRRGHRMTKLKTSPDQRIIEFPALGTATSVIGPESGLVRHSTPLKQGSVSPAVQIADLPLMCEVVLSGSYRKDFQHLKRTYEEFRDIGCNILSPTSVSAVREEDGFVYMEGEETDTPERIEERHLSAIQRASLVALP